MSLFITSLNSGSNGNCYYIGNSTEAVLVDAGLSCRETEKRMARLGLDIGRVKAVFISHEHSDHIFGLPGIGKKYNLPVFITDRTRLTARIKINPSLVNTFYPFVPVEVGSLSVYAFPKQHDAADPHSFIVSGNSVRVGIFTDIGYPCNHVIDCFSRCHAVFLESNYDETMLHNGPYPYHLKQRIRGGMGHLSNTQALQLFTGHRPTFMSHLFLAHLSRQNNSPEIVKQLFEPVRCGTAVYVASRYCETEVCQIETGGTSTNLPAHKSNPLQLSLF